MMNNFLNLAPALAIGVLIGILFFGGLWWTVQKLVSSKRPELWFFGSMLLRTGIALAAFYFIAGGNWQRLIVCLIGFITARFIVVRFTIKKQNGVMRTG
jgi:F1F0 ATPase subunit 2